MKFDICVPLLGFEDIKQVGLEKIDEIFMKLSSDENRQVSFTLVNPFVLREYDFEVPPKIKEKLEIDENSNILIQNIVLIQTPIEDSIVNFMAPLIFNTDNNKVAQVIISDNNNYGIAEKISKYLKSS